MSLQDSKQHVHGLLDELKSFKAELHSLEQIADQVSTDGRCGTRSALAAANRAGGFVTPERIDIELGTNKNTLEYLEKARAAAAEVVLRAYSKGPTHLQIELEKLIPVCRQKGGTPRANLEKWHSIMTAEDTSTTIDQSKWTDDLILLGLAHLTEVRFACTVVTHTEVVPAELLPIGASWLHSPEAKDRQGGIMLWLSKPNTGQHIEVVRRMDAAVLPAGRVLDLSDERAREAHVTRAVNTMSQAQRNREEQEEEDMCQAIWEHSEQLDKYQQEDDKYRGRISAVMAESADQQNRKQLDDDQFHRSLAATLNRSLASLQSPAPTSDTTAAAISVSPAVAVLAPLASERSKLSEAMAQFSPLGVAATPPKTATSNAAATPLAPPGAATSTVPPVCSTSVQ